MMGGEGKDSDMRMVECKEMRERKNGGSLEGRGKGEA